VIDEDKVSGRLLDKISEHLKAPKRELMNLLTQGGKGRGGEGLQIVNMDWVINCFDRGELVDDSNYLM
jgi:hypothetical protein